jgi:hypothetical protein
MHYIKLTHSLLGLMSCYFNFELHLVHTLIDSKDSNKEMILDAAETILGFFGFDRTVYNNLKRNNMKRKWRWYEELKEQRTRDINRDALMLKEKIYCMRLKR